MLNKNDLIRTYLLTKEENKGSNLYISGNALINYSTCIAYKKDGLLYLNVEKYSVTTTKNQNLLRRIAGENNIRICECTEEQIYKVSNL